MINDRELCYNVQIVVYTHTASNEHTDSLSLLETREKMIETCDVKRAIVSEQPVS